MYLIILIFCFFVFLYILHYIAREDFVITRKDIHMDKIFNMAFLTGFFSLFVSRVFFVLFHPELKFLNPVGFLAFPYFPGLSLIGGIIGGAIFVYFYSEYRKMPNGKMLDLFILSLIGTLPVGFIVTFILLLGKTGALFNFLFVFSVLLSIIFKTIFYPFSSKGEIRDGTLGLIFIALFSFLYFLTKMFLNIKMFSFLDPENLLLLISLFSALILILNQEKMNNFLGKNE